MTEGESGSSRRGSGSLEEWLRGRTPEVPESFLPMLAEEGEAPISVEELRRLGEEALERALAHPGKDRRAAFDLLAGDAFITYACELLAREDDPGGMLDGLLKELGGRFSP